MAQAVKPKFYACDTCNKAFSSKYTMNRHRNTAHLGIATKFTCGYANCTYSCHRPEDLLMHERRHMDPNFKTKQKNTQINNNLTTQVQNQTESNSDVGYSHQEFVAALQQQQLPEPDAYSTIDFSILQENTEPQVITTLAPSAIPTTSTTASTTIDQDLYQPLVSDISNDSSSETLKYQPGLHIYADDQGTLKTDPNFLVPGMKYICSDKYELFSETSKEYKTMTKADDNDPTLASFNVTISKNPGKNDVNQCKSQ